MKSLACRVRKNFKQLTASDMNVKPYTKGSFSLVPIPNTSCLALKNEMKQNKGKASMLKGEEKTQSEETNIDQNQTQM